MKNFKKLIKEALTPDFLTEYNQTQGREEYRDMDFEVLYSPEDGYSIESERYEIVNPNAYFSTYAEAVEHAEIEIDGYLGEWEEDDDLLDDNDSDWVEDPNWAKLEENMALSKELENHPDFDILVSTLEDSLGIEIERSLRSGKYNGREGYYLRTPDVNTWTENAKEMITQALDTASAKAQDHTFEFEGVSDYELEPGERSWDASIEFFINREESVNEDQKSVDSYIKKWNDKMKGSSRSTAKDWVDGIKGISKEDKESILKGIKESVNELDMHDPVLAMVRRRQMQDDAEKAKQAELNQKFGKNWSDKFNSEVDLKNELADLKDEREQMMIDMEQEAEPEGGEIADDYGSRLNDIDARMAAIKSDLDDLRMYESVNEDDLDVNYSDADAGDESIEKESASGAYESKTFDFKKVIKEALTPDYLKK